MAVWGKLCPRLMQLDPVLSRTPREILRKPKLTGTERDPVTTPSCGDAVVFSQDGTEDMTGVSRVGGERGGRG